MNDKELKNILTMMANLLKSLSISETKRWHSEDLRQFEWYHKYSFRSKKKEREELTKKHQQEIEDLNKNFEKLLEKIENLTNKKQD